MIQEFSINESDIDLMTNQEQLKHFNPFCSSEGAMGNGALVRLSPVPLFFHRDPVKAVEYAGISGQLTHGDIRVRDACRYYGALIVAALRGESKAELLDKNFFEKHQPWFNEEPLDQDILSMVRGFHNKRRGYDDGIRAGDNIINAMEAALWAFQNDGDSFEIGALMIVNLGDDNNTAAAIYGQLAGAFYGFTNLPREWVEKLYAKEFIELISVWLCGQGLEWSRRQENV